MANQIQLRFFGRQSYVSDIYIGSHLVKNTIIFDTRTKWTAVIVNGVDGAPISSYQIQNSDSAVPIISEATDEIEEKTILMDWV